MGVGVSQCSRGLAAALCHDVGAASRKVADARYPIEDASDYVEDREHQEERKGIQYPQKDSSTGRGHLQTPDAVGCHNHTRMKA